MALMKLFPEIYVPTFEMKVGGRPLDQNTAKTVLDISVVEHQDPPSRFSFRLNDPTLKFINREDGLFVEGVRVEISLGYVGDTRKMMVGEISGLTADFPSSGPATLSVEGFDLLHGMTRGTAYRRFEIPDHQIVSEIASGMGLRCSTDPTRGQGPRVQDHVTDLRFLQQLAELDGYDLWVEEDTLYFKRERPAPNTLELEWGKTLVSFSPRLSTAGQVNAVEVRGWDPVQKQSFSFRADRAASATAELSAAGQQQLSRGTGGRSERVIQGSSVSGAQDAEGLAQRMIAEQQQAAITGNGASIGKADMRVGTILALKGIGRFNGRYVVQQVTHTVGSRGYQTTFQVARA